MPRSRHPCPEGSVSGRDRFGRRLQPQERRLGAGPGSLPSAPDLAPPPRAPPGARVPSRRRRARSFADVTPRAEVTFSRGWTRRSVAGRGRACRFSSGDIHIIFVTGVGRGRGVPGVRASSRPGPPHRSRALALAGTSCRPKPPGEPPLQPPPPRRRRPLLRGTPNRTAAPRTCLWPGERAKPLRRPARGKGARRMRRGWRRGAWRGRVSAGGRSAGGGGPSVPPAAAARRGEGDRGLGARARAEPPEGSGSRLTGVRRVGLQSLSEVTGAAFPPRDWRLAGGG